MDANGLRSFGLAWGRGLFGWPSPFDESSQVEAATSHRIDGVRLANRAAALPLVEVRNSTDQVALEPAMVIDAGGNTMRWDRARGVLVSTSALADTHPDLESVDIALPAGALPVADLALGDDDVLYIAGGGLLWLIDLRARFEATSFAIVDGESDVSGLAVTPQKLAALPGGGVLVLDAARGRIARVAGLPMFTTGVQPTRDTDTRFDRCDPNPRPLTATVFPARFDADERPIAIACNRVGCAVVMSLGLAAGGARIRLLRSDGRFSTAVALAGPRFPNTLAWLGDEQLALATQASVVEPGRAPRDPGVFVYAVDAALRERLAQTRTKLPNDGVAALPALGDYCPLAGWTGGPFVNGAPGTRLAYPRSDRRVGAGPVARVSLASRCSQGVVANVAFGVDTSDAAQAAVGRIDTRVAETVWHRLHAEACVPTGTAMIVWLAANDTVCPAFDTSPARQRDGWHAHLIGDRRALPDDIAAALLPDIPVATWSAAASDVPFGSRLLGCTAVPDRTGLFSVLVQRAGRAVRGLRGSRLWVVVELFGDGRATPELVSLRFAAGRVSYRDRYLPALYHETAFGSAAEQPGRATGADFLERLIHLFEGPFTEIEDRIAGAWALTDPQACPDDALPWLAGWIGLALEPGTPPARGRSMIANAPRLAQRHGTLAGLVLALDIATDGAVTRGRIVVFENWRLRRTLATILGAALKDHADPLTAGISQSGNSFVGDSLFLGDENAKTFLALFRDLRVDPKANHFQARRQRDEREAAIHALYDGLAHRATVLVHDQASDDERRLVERLAQSAAPAHVRLSVVSAGTPFMVGVASLVGADTYLRAPIDGHPVQADRSQLGSIDTLQGLASLDANSGAFDDLITADNPTTSPAPTARIRSETGPVGPTASFTLDGSASTAAPGRRIDLYTWSHQPPV